jgi:hypothetical protein
MSFSAFLLRLTDLVMCRLRVVVLSFDSLDVIFVIRPAILHALVLRVYHAQCLHQLVCRESAPQLLDQLFCHSWSDHNQGAHQTPLCPFIESRKAEFT